MTLYLIFSLYFFAAISMIVSCVSFPFGWNSDEFRKICGPEANRFEVGLCGIRWAYALAIIGTSLLFYFYDFEPFSEIRKLSFCFIILLACIDGCILASLAFILATRHIRLQPEPTYQRNQVFKGEVNNAYITDVSSIAGSGSRKSLNLKPVLLVTPPHHPSGGDDSISQFSSRAGTHNQRFHNPMHHHQFQL